MGIYPTRKEIDDAGKLTPCSDGVVFEQYNMPGIKTDERGIATMEKIKQAWFKDTGGNILTIAEFG